LKRGTTQRRHLWIAFVNQKLQLNWKLIYNFQNNNLPVTTLNISIFKKIAILFLSLVFKEKAWATFAKSDIDILPNKYRTELSVGEKDYTLGHN
jgi:hypothetical protein